MAQAQTEHDLPATIPIFPLPAVLLLPAAKLPLNIFEPRYLDMVRDAMAGPRIIGMVQPRDPDMSAAVPEVYGVGGAGRITAYRETKDDRLLISLTGLSRFQIAEELSVTTRYRQVNADWRGFAHDLASDQDESTAEVREPLLAALRRYLEVSRFQVDWQAIENTPTSALSDNLSLACPFEPSEKQALLEASDHAARAALLTALLDMAVAGHEGGHGGGAPPLH